MPGPIPTAPPPSLVHATVASASLAAHLTGGGGGGGGVGGSVGAIVKGVLSGVTIGIGKVVAGGVAKGVGLSAGALLAAASAWVAGGAMWLLSGVGAAITATTQPQLGGAWFTGRQAVIAQMAASAILPMLCCAAIQAIYRQQAGALTRAFLVQLPLALLLTGAAMEIVKLSLAAVDAMSAQIMTSAGVDARHLLPEVTTFLSSAAAGGSAAPGFAVFLGGILVAAGALVLWLELVVRAAAVAAAALFLPLVLAALVWPAVSHWCRRLADTLAALILSKLVVAAILSLAVGAVTAGVSGAGGHPSADFGDVVLGVALLLLSTLSPFVLLRMIPAVEAGAVAHLESARHQLRRSAVMPARLAASFASFPAGGAIGAAGGANGRTPALGAGAERSSGASPNGGSTSRPTMAAVHAAGAKLEPPEGQASPRSAAASSPAPTAAPPATAGAARPDPTRSGAADDHA